MLLMDYIVNWKSSDSSKGSLRKTEIIMNLSRTLIDTCRGYLLHVCDRRHVNSRNRDIINDVGKTQETPRGHRHQTKSLGKTNIGLKFFVNLALLIRSPF